MSNIYIQIDDDTYLSIHQDEESGVQECVPMRYSDNTLLGEPIHYATVDELADILDDVVHRDYSLFNSRPNQFNFTFDEEVTNDN